VLAEATSAGPRASAAAKAPVLPVYGVAGDDWPQDTKSLVALPWKLAGVMDRGSLPMFAVAAARDHRLGEACRGVDWRSVTHPRRLMMGSKYSIVGSC